ncbi:unnamed protein product [Brassica oleracea]|uniref:(rape) hypothetical protein n=1 Tax=Brassica napus TaxID=3708 RepID=A0A816REY1_BRANA|nr:unnamed protein product [Brassica napus]
MTHFDTPNHKHHWDFVGILSVFCKSDLDNSDENQPTETHLIALSSTSAVDESLNFSPELKTSDKAGSNSQMDHEGSKNI